MPHTVTADRPVSQIRKGDEVNGAVVADVDRKVKWATVTFEDGSHIRVEVDSLVSVSRVEPTEEEKLAAQREHQMDTLRWTLKGLQSDGLAKFVDRVGQWGGVSWDSATEFFHQQAMYKVGRGLDHIMGLNRYAHLSEDDKIVTAFAIFVDRVEGDRRRSVPDPISRSTNALSNLIEDLDRWAEDTVLDKIRWSRKIVDARLAELKEEEVSD